MSVQVGEDSIDTVVVARGEVVTSSVNVNTTDATTSATALLLPAQNTHTFLPPQPSPLTSPPAPSPPPSPPPHSPPPLFPRPALPPFDSLRTPPGE